MRFVSEQKQIKTVDLKEVEFNNELQQNNRNLQKQLKKKTIKIEELYEEISQFK